METSREEDSKPATVSVIALNQIHWTEGSSSETTLPFSSTCMWYVTLFVKRQIYKSVKWGDKSCKVYCKQIVWTNYPWGNPCFHVLFCFLRPPHQKNNRTGRKAAYHDSYAFLFGATSSCCTYYYLSKYPLYTQNLNLLGIMRHLTPVIRRNEAEHLMLYPVFITCPW